MTVLEKSLLLIEMGALKTKVQKAQAAINPKIQTWSISTAFEQIFLSIDVIRSEIEKAP